MRTKRADAARRLDRGTDATSALLVDFGDDHARAFGGEAHGDRFAETGARAGNDRHLAVESAHAAALGRHSRIVTHFTCV